MHPLSQHIERVRRHYEQAVRTDDEIALMDLAHTMRTWADLKGGLKDLAPGLLSTLTFRSGTPTKKFFRAVKAGRYVLAYMPDPVKTYAANRHVISGPGYEGDGNSFEFSALFKVNYDDSLELGAFCAATARDDDSIPRNVQAQTVVSKGNFVQWMGAELVRFGLTDAHGTLVHEAWSREKVIRRVANKLGGSHPLNANASEDLALSHLQQFRLGGLSLPYFLVLSAAQDLLNVVPRIIEKGR